MKRRNLLLAAAVISAAALAYVAGRLHDAGLVRPAADPASIAPVSSAPQPNRPAEPLRKSAILAPTQHRFARFTVGEVNVKALFADGPDLWIGTSKGVIHYQMTTGQHTIYDNKSGLLSNGVFYISKVKGEIWIGTYGGGLSVLNPKTETWRNYNVPQGMADAFCYGALVTHDGDYWIATWSGANRVRKGEIDNLKAWQTFTVANTGGGLPNDWVYGLAEGKNGEIWFATEGGLARFVDGKWSHWDHKDGLGADYDVVKAEIPFRNDPGQVSSHHAMQKKQQGLGNVDIAYNPNYIVSLAIDEDGKVWAGTWGAGLSVFDGKSFKTYTMKDGLPANHIFMLKRDAKGGMWIGTSHGLVKHDGHKFIRFGMQDGLVSENVFSMAITASGDTWVGTFGGVTHFPDGLKRNPPG